MEHIEWQVAAACSGFCLEDVDGITVVFGGKGLYGVGVLQGELGKIETGP